MEPLKLCLLFLSFLDLSRAKQSTDADLDIWVLELNFQSHVLVRCFLQIITKAGLEEAQACIWCAGRREESTNVRKVFRELCLGIQMKTPLLDFVLPYSNNEIVADFKAQVVSLNKGCDACLMLGPRML